MIAGCSRAPADRTGVPPEFVTACGHPGSTVTVTTSTTVPHANCDLTGVVVTSPGRGGLTVPATGFVAISSGVQVSVDPTTHDVTITVETGPIPNA